MDPFNYNATHFLELKKKWTVYEKKKSDCQQFHQYQQNEQSPLGSNHQSERRRQLLSIEIRSLDRHRNTAGLNQLMESQPIYKFWSQSIVA